MTIDKGFIHYATNSPCVWYVHYNILDVKNAFIIYYVMKYRKILIKYNDIFHSRENIKTCIFTVVKIQNLIFSRVRNLKIGTIFFYFLNMV